MRTLFFILVVTVFVTFGEARRSSSSSSSSEEIQHSPLFRKALKNRHFANDVRYSSHCRGKPAPINHRILEAVVRCNGPADYACYKTCILDQLDLTEGGKINMRGVSQFFDEILGKHSNLKQGAMRAFDKCFDGGRIRLKGPSGCSKNRKVIDCLIAKRRKHCNIESNSLEN